jgi:hypothetical protein
MSNFAYVPNIVNGKGIVEDVIVIEQEQIDTGLWGNPSDWIQTSYNTYGGVHYGQDGNPDGDLALRGNFASKNDIYDQNNDVFYKPQPFPSWLISESTWTWYAPISIPNDVGTGTPPKFYTWNESNKSWDFLKTN